MPGGCGNVLNFSLRRIQYGTAPPGQQEQPLEKCPSLIFLRYTQVEKYVRKKNCPVLSKLATLSSSKLSLEVWLSSLYWYGPTTPIEITNLLTHLTYLEEELHIILTYKILIAIYLNHLFYYMYITQRTTIVIRIALAARRTTLLLLSFRPHYFIEFIYYHIDYQTTHHIQKKSPCIY